MPDDFLVAVNATHGLVSVMLQDETISASKCQAESSGAIRHAGRGRRHRHWRGKRKPGQDLSRMSTQLSSVGQATRSGYSNPVLAAGSKPPLHHCLRLAVAHELRYGRRIKLFTRAKTRRRHGENNQSGFQ